MTVMCFLGSVMGGGELFMIKINWIKDFISYKKWNSFKTVITLYTYAISLRVNILNKIVIKHQLSYMIDLNVWLTEKSIASHIKKKGLAWNIII